MIFLNYKLSNALCSLKESLDCSGVQQK